MYDFVKTDYSQVFDTLDNFHFAHSIADRQMRSGVHDMTYDLYRGRPANIS